MQRQLSLLERVKFACSFIFKRHLFHASVTTCGKCGGMNIVEAPGAENLKRMDTPTAKLFWKSKLKCLDCGAECEEKQIWCWKRDEMPYRNEDK